MIRNNWTYKLMALAVAITLYFFANSERNPQSSKLLTKVPIKIVNLQEGYVAELAQRSVDIKLQGPKSAVDSISAKDVEATVDLAGISASRTIERVLKIEPHIEGDVEVKSMTPETINVRVEVLGDKRLPVEVRYPAVPPLGYAYGNPEISPSSVSISGKVSEVSRVKKIVLTLPTHIPSGPLDESFKVVPLDSKGDTVTEIQLDAEKVHLKLALVEVPATKSVIVSPEVVGVPAFPGKVTSVTVTPSLVTLQGRPAALTGVSTIDTERISVDGANESVSRNVDLRVPPGVTVRGSDKVRISVEITGQPQSGSSALHINP